MVNGKRYTKDGFSTKKAAQNWEQDQRKLSRSAGEDITLSRLCVDYLDYCGKKDEQGIYSGRFPIRTYNEKRGACDRLLQAFGKTILATDIEPLTMSKHLAGRGIEVSANASNKDRKNIRAMYVWASGMYKGFKYNPVTEMVKALPHDRQPQYVPPEADVLKVVMACNREQWIFLDTYLQTGARKSEIFRLTWEDIDFTNHKIRLGTRKTKTGSLEYHTIDMSQELEDNLKWWWKNRPIKECPYVFYDTDSNSPHYGQTFTTRRRFLKGLCKRAGVKEFGFHAIRRYVASILAAKGVPTKVIQMILGHHSITTTEKYIYNIISDQREIMNKLSTGNAFNDVATDVTKKSGEAGT